MKQTQTGLDSFVRRKGENRLCWSIKLCSIQIKRVSHNEIMIDYLDTNMWHNKTLRTERDILKPASEVHLNKVIYRKCGVSGCFCFPVSAFTMWHLIAAHHMMTHGGLDVKHWLVSHHDSLWSHTAPVNRWWCVTHVFSFYLCCFYFTHVHVNMSETFDKSVALPTCAPLPAFV